MIGFEPRSRTERPTRFGPSRTGVAAGGRTARWDAAERSGRFRELALRLSSAPPGSGALIEESSDEAGVRLFVEPSALFERGFGDAPLRARGEESAERGAMRYLDLVLERERETSARPATFVRGATAVAPSRDLRIDYQTFLVRTRQGVEVARRVRWSTEPGRRSPPDELVASAVVREWAIEVGGPVVGRRRIWPATLAWRRGDARAIPPEAWWRWRGGRVAGEGPPVWEAPTAFRASALPRVVFGGSGAGKTEYLAAEAAITHRRGDAVWVVDIHGDLAPRLFARLSETERSGLVAVDASEPASPGFNLLAASAPGIDDRLAAYLVGALKRLTPDGESVYWGFRLERLFDAFVRLTQERGGSLIDLVDLLTSARRRDEARWSTRRPELARFLDEIGPIVQRTPDLFWPAASRLGKVALVPAIQRTIARSDGPLDVEALLADGRAVVVRLPIDVLGSETAGFAANLLLARAYYGALASAGRRRPVAFVLDEAHAFSPRLLAEMVNEGRKFAVRTVVATQYPDRLAPELRDAVAGSAASRLVFRLPPPVASTLGDWVGLPSAAAAELLPALPTGASILSDRSVDLRPVLVTIPGAPPPAPGAIGSGWTEAVRPEAGAPGADDPEERATMSGEDEVTRRLLLAVLGADERREKLSPAAVVEAARRSPGPSVPDAVWLDRWRAIERAGLVAADGERVVLSAAGAVRLGLSAPTGAVRESVEHRRLLLRAFCLFARHGCYLEIVRQGRFDTPAPDGRYRQLAGAPYAGPPVETAAWLDRVRSTWAWRYFGGLDVHVEAEVSGALRTERLARDLEKARRAGAFCLFVVGDGRRAQRVKQFLALHGATRRTAAVWTLPVAPRGDRWRANAVRLDA